MKKSAGFTVIELLVVVVFVAVAGWLFFNEKATVTAVQRDNQRKVAINAMYYSLEEVFYDKNHYYPQTVDSKTLRSVDPALFNDPSGVALGTSSSNYRYEATGCTTDGQCTGYTLQSTMEREDAYKKTNRSH